MYFIQLAFFQAYHLFDLLNWGTPLNHVLPLNADPAIFSFYNLKELWFFPKNLFFFSCSRACWHYFSHMKTHAIWTNDRKIISSLSYLVHTLRNAFSHRNSLSIIFLRLYSSWSYSHGFMRFFFGGTTGLCPKTGRVLLFYHPHKLYPLSTEFPNS